MSRDRVLNHHIMTSLYLTLFPGVLCFGYKTFQNVGIQHHYSLISEMLSILSIDQANKDKQRRKVSRRELYQTIANHVDFRRLSAVHSAQAIVRLILLAFRQKPPFQLLAFTSGKTTTNPND